MSAGILSPILGKTWQGNNTAVMKTNLEAILRIVKFKGLCLGKKKCYKMPNYSIKKTKNFSSCNKLCN